MEQDSINNSCLKVVYEDRTGTKIYELVTSDRSHSPLANFAKKKQNRTAASKLMTTLERIAEIGVYESERLGYPLVKQLDGEIVEVRVSSTVIRAVSYLDNGENILVILSVHEAHQGNSNMSEQIKLAKKKVPIVKRLIEELRTKNDE